MSENIVLDTNAYALLLKRPKDEQCLYLEKILTKDLRISFSISEITSLEIHSVIGQYRRGANSQKHTCKKEIILKDGSQACCFNTWIQHRKKKLNNKMYRDILKLITHIETGNGNITANVIKLNRHSFKIGSYLLKKYADQHSFGSHDALITGATIDRMKTTGEENTLVTFDKKLIKVLVKESIPHINLNRT